MTQFAAQPASQPRMCLSSVLAAKQKHHRCYSKKATQKMKINVMQPIGIKCASCKWKMSMGLSREILMRVNTKNLAPKRCESH